MRLSIVLILLFIIVPLDGAFAQLADTGNFHIVWEVKNRFRLFRNEDDFLRMAAASRGDGILAAERRLERDTDGEGWAKDVVANLCLDNFGNLLDTCERDGERENYLAPRDHPIGLTIAGPVPQDATCVWNFDDGDGPLKQTTVPCDQEVRLRVRSGPDHGRHRRHSARRRHRAARRHRDRGARHARRRSGRFHRRRRG